MAAGAGAGKVDAGEGRPEPLGVTVLAGGANVAVHAPDATRVEFCLFDPAGETEIARIPLEGRTDGVFHGFVEGVRPGRRYGLRAHGPFDPDRGLRFNPNRLLLDPFALELDRPFALRPEMFDAAWEADSGPFMPKAVTQPTGPVRPGPPPPDWPEAVIYELHVKGFTAANPDIPGPLRGTFAGLAHPAAIGHLQRLGVTVVELMPCAAWIDERHLGPLGLTNYWGYNPVALCAPDPRLAPGGWAEVRAATDALGAAGIATVLDVVLNHTGEGDDLGPTVSLRGLDNAGYYRLRPDQPSRYVDDAGTGNTLALDRPPGLRLALDALRAWRRHGGVSGFRFDLATVLGRRDDGFDPQAPLLKAIEQDPELRELMLIAEPWDVGPGGYQVGRFPAGWGEWNDRFRDDLRGFWRGEGVSLGQLARRLAGSQDLFGARRPSRSINFVTAHDGFTLADLVAFERKHNQANGEDGRDGSNHNLSWNHGVEGPSDDPDVPRARAGDVRAILACLILARGSPMLSMGDELGRSQGGNNNSYAQDNPTSWLDWASKDEALLGHVARLIAIRREHPAFRTDRFLTGTPAAGQIDPDVAWRLPGGAEPTPAEWDDPGGQALVMVLAERSEGDLDRVALVIHRGPGPLDVALPEPRDGFEWTVLSDSADDARQGRAGEQVSISPRSVLVLAEAAAPARRSRPVDPAVLAHLASAAGIAPEWWDVEGHRTQVTPETQAALLAAMRLPAATNRQALESLRDLAAAHDRRALPLALTQTESGSSHIDLPAGESRTDVDTWLIFENELGEVTRLRADASDGQSIEIAGRDGSVVPGLRMVLPSLLAGRYRLRREDAPDLLGRLTIAPAACHLPPALEHGGRAWGLSAQLYSLARKGDQGIGDFATLGLLGEAAAGRGAGAVAINPLHALFSDRRDRASPYYPSDRRFLDPIYLDVDGLPRGGDRASVDYPGVWALKSKALEQRFSHVAGSPAFEAFVSAGGRALEGFALFQALSEERPGQDWRAWPEGLRRPDSPQALQFAASHGERLRFHMFLQWLCEEQLRAAAARASGLAIGFCRDLAIGAAPDGAEVWSGADLIASGASLGAPPDPIAPQGQVWGLPPYDPHRLRAEGYASLSDLFARNMRHAGALRIDHVMGLARQFWVPDGGPGEAGAYVAFPLRDLLGELALESVRAGCMVVGEDLGTVPEGLRETLQAAKVLSYRVLPFERAREKFLPPASYPVLACACVSTHDLAPLAGWWSGADIAERATLGLLSADEAAAAKSERSAEKRALIAALAAAGLASADEDPDGALDPALAGAIHGYIARSPSVLALAQADDLAGEGVGVNLPGTDTERPNWRRRIGAPIESLFDGELAVRIMDALRTERPG